MKFDRLLLVLKLILVVSVASAFAGPTDGIAGKWNMVAESNSQTVAISVTITADGEKFTGTTSSEIGSGQIINGKLDGDKFTATLKTEVLGAIYEFTMEGKLTKDGMSGTLSNSNFGSVSFTATRAKD